ncbi:DUF202 domain-containing protein [[Pseudomonas] carboxydohydrogena]|uniref:DUF202 domain-containing protein n=1 Tax=Afipia carboxydohydrogena TaxID=290 RepID=A0ABY8BLT6_AFICR|nr:DUF202 domain-containing protein [[Pseudomonas] carboxydohydrogena]WEF50949.1 DUF202 domain-containing protein [[Pseudomonas] carboxydohydrogena]
MLGRDPGLQPERTGLAWSRTGLLALIVASLSIRIGLSATAAFHLLAALLLAALGCASLHRGRQRSRCTASEQIVTSTSRKYLLAASTIVVIASAIHAGTLLARLLK